MDDKLEADPTHTLMPELHWCGRVLGEDVYVNTHSPRKRDLVEQVLTKAIENLDKEDN